MDADGYLPLLISLVGACAAGPLSARLPPRTATWLLTLIGAVLAGSGAAALGVLALGGALRLEPVAVLGHLSERVPHRGDDPGAVTAAVAAAVLAGCVPAAFRTAFRQVRALRAAARTARSLPGDGDVTILDDPAVEAFALPGRPGRIVVSTGMLAILSDGERRALLAHERAHVSGRHHLFRAVTAVATAANPLLWPLRGAVAFTTERWADEAAAAAVGDRAMTARAIGKAALAVGRPSGSGPAAALGVGGGVPGAVSRFRGSRPGPVPRRVAALLKAPPPARPGLVMAAVAVAVVAVLTVQDGAVNVYDVFEHEQAAAPHRAGAQAVMLRH
ncbi:M56 family metallopeptidase [Actinomadura fibrosa]|uniref:M56 family metallopeptidase n=1 Tax=Actinomadura fibrosa TaxID=111802 RepID=A0ABW2XNQ9_9ACTN|nr:M56 family metallopeptidase [Actinomadura fibrosa]